MNNRLRWDGGSVNSRNGSDRVIPCDPHIVTYNLCPGASGSHTTSPVVFVRLCRAGAPVQHEFMCVQLTLLVILNQMALESTARATSESEPFETGTELQLIVDGETIRYHVRKPFLPFTKSAVVLAQPTKLLGDGTNDASLVVVKIFDPRVLDDRTATKTTHPWSLAAEQRAAQERAREGFEWDDSVLYEDEPDSSDKEGLALRAAQWEQNFYSLAMQCFDTERAAYEHLQELQGTAIPRLLGVGRWDVGPTTRAIQPPVLVFEYVEGISLRDINPELLDPTLCASLVAAVDGFASLGVCHTDLNEGNILFSPPEHPLRAVVIDFGCATVRDEDFSEEDWSETVQFEADSKWIHKILEKKGVEVST